MEKAILVSIRLKKERIPLLESLTELKQLAATAGAQTIEVLTQQRDRPDPKYFIGEGKLLELKSLSSATQADLIIFDHEISASQARNLESALNLKVIDRTELILDIFAQHAQSREGALQVKLAQSEFMLTRLTGHGVALSRLGGGIGTRGPGETKLEMDRRRIRKNISLLKKELETVRKNRHLLREGRRASRVLTGVLVGYTNSGKSTLLNSLSRSHILAQDKLFSTLDPVTRRVYLPEGRVILLTDTVGFIQKLPHQLVDAFRATLEEVTEADLLLHVMDASSGYLEDQIAAVYTVLEELRVITKPILSVFNKMDKAGDPARLKKLIKKYQPAVAVSALHKTGLEDLLKVLSRQLGQLI
jgi:GTP-binding protein HflX